MEFSDEKLIDEYLEGDDQAISLLVDRYFSDAYRFSFSIVKEKQMAEDIVQESFIKAWKNVRKFIPQKSFRTWLFSIIHNTAIDYLRTKKSIPFSNLGDNMLENIPDSSISREELLNQAQNMQYVQELLNQINPKYQEVILLRQKDDLTFEKISQVLNRPLHTVKSQYRRGIASINRLLKTQNLSI